MLEIEASEAEKTFGALLNRVAQGAKFVITRHGKPIARLVPSSVGIEELRARAAFDRIRARAGLLRESFDWDTVKADRDTGRL